MSHEHTHRENVHSRTARTHTGLLPNGGGVCVCVSECGFWCSARTVHALRASTPAPHRANCVHSLASHLCGSPAPRSPLLYGALATHSRSVRAQCVCLRDAVCADDDDAKRTEIRSLGKYPECSRTNTHARRARSSSSSKTAVHTQRRDARARTDKHKRTRTQRPPERVCLTRTRDTLGRRRPTERQRRFTNAEYQQSQRHSARVLTPVAYARTHPQNAYPYIIQHQRSARRAHTQHTASIDADDDDDVVVDNDATSTTQQQQQCKCVFVCVCMLMCWWTCAPQRHVYTRVEYVYI